jgi:hypothetical protein
MSGLDKDLAAILCMFVEATRAVPRNQRRPISGFSAIGQLNWVLSHPGLPTTNNGLYPADLRALESYGFVSADHRDRSTVEIEVTPAGFAEYERIQRDGREPTERVEAVTRRFIATDDFRRRHRTACARWDSAEALLWHSETDEHFSAVGHYCREAAQEFASSLLSLYAVVGADSNPTRVKNRVRAVLDARRTDSKRVNETSAALLNLWEAVIDLFQRQEHGAQKGGDALTWEDARRVVFLTLMAMTELDRVVALPQR